MSRFRIFFKRSALLAIMLSVTGCVSYPTFPSATEQIPALISGELAFGAEIEPAVSADLLKMSDEMHAFIAARKILDSTIPYTRFRRLMAGLVDGGYFSNHYRADGTYSAQQTFASAEGNCLGYTNMFIALARAAGLNASYQLIENYPAWDVNAGQLVRNNHINVIVDEIGLAGRYTAELVVDFNIVQPDADFARPTLVSDAFAEALYHINLAIDELNVGDLEGSFAQLKRAALSDPENKFVWNNLGVFYSRLGKSEVAQQAYEVALSIDNRDKSALAGMVVSLTAQGQLAEAAEFERRVYWYQRRNPYYHYARANLAFEKEDFDEALVAIEQAIDLRGNDARFFAFRAATAGELGDDRLMRRSETLAAKYQKSNSPAPEKVNVSYYGKLEVNGS
ncbi:MAG: hypothetical protein GKR90_14400 [Pseudomonadales bacterium]|nr:hypothetical protein [Pseudomonadales bacterium]